MLLLLFQTLPLFLCFVHWTNKGIIMTPHWVAIFFYVNKKATPLSLFRIIHSLQLPTQRQSNSSATIPALNRLCERVSGIFKSVQGRERNMAFKEGSSLAAWWSCSHWAFDVCVLRLNLTWPCNIKHCFINKKEMGALPLNEYRAHCFKFNITQTSPWLVFVSLCFMLHSHRFTFDSVIVFSI